MKLYDLIRLLLRIYWRYGNLSVCTSGEWMDELKPEYLVIFTPDGREINFDETQVFPPCDGPQRPYLEILADT